MRGEKKCLNENLINADECYSISNKYIFSHCLVRQIFKQENQLSSVETEKGLTTNLLIK
jgi:hypothetical protein